MNARGRTAAGESGVPLLGPVDSVGGHAVELAGEVMVALAERVLLWPARRTLFAADVHFGKAARFRVQGVPVPAGTTAHDLARLDALVAACRLERLVFLGDLWHGRLRADSPTLATLAQWRACRRALALELVPGNHDRATEAMAASLDIALRPEADPEGPFVLRHHPDPHAGGYVLAGHVHPVVRLSGAGRDRLRAPCFVFGEAVGLLPSFGAFTGGHVITPAAGDRVLVVAGDRVLPLPVRTRGRASAR
jgi:DNA ligase-associated metallophosphoesterase